MVFIPVELWNKVMSEVKECRFAGPYKLTELPFDSFIQSPIGLVPKDGGLKTRLIFHLSYDFGEEEGKKSLNYFTPDELCSERYNDLDDAVKKCLKLLKVVSGAKGLFYAKVIVQMLLGLSRF